MIRARVYDFLEDPRHDYLPGRVFGWFIAALVTLSVAAVVLESVEELRARYAAVFHAFEVFSVAVFSAEYFLRMWSCTIDPRYRAAVTGRIRFALTPLALIDLAAILPFFLLLGAGMDMRFVRILRLFRLFRIAKLGRYSKSLRTFAAVLTEKRAELLVITFVVLVLLVGSSSVLYFAEYEAQPDKFSSIPAAMWWGIATLSTVGYGDISPVTPLGKLCAGVVALLGIGLFAVPAGVLGSGFVAQIEKERAPKAACPHCGREIDLKAGGAG